MQIQSHPPKASKGVALIAVLWIVAALGIAVTGLTKLAKDEIRQTSLDRAAIIATAAADAAIRLSLQDLSAKPVAGTTGFSAGPVVFEGRQIMVQIQSLSGLIDINHAPEALLADLFRYAVSMPPAQSALLAQNIVQARARPSTTGPRSGFDAPEDLLQVPGMTYDIYSGIQPLITASLSGGGRVDPMAAPWGVLLVLANGNQGLASKINAERAAGNTQIDTTQLNQTFIERSSSRVLTIQAIAQLGDGATLTRVWWVSPAFTGAAKSPWRVLHVSKRISLAQ
jgi:general secretion pathway protein K